MSRSGHSVNKQDIGEPEATAFLLDRLGADIVEVVAVGHGDWSKAFTYRHGGEAYVIRFGMHLDDYQRDQRAARHATPEMPIPAILELGTAYGGHYAISKRALGGYLDQLSGAEMKALLPALFRMLDAARNADLSATTGYGAWGQDGNSEYSTWAEALLDVGNDRPGERVSGWRDRMEASATGIAPFDEALRLLKVLVNSVSVDRYLVHSDLLNYNVIVQDDAIKAVIDWGCSKYGDFLYDLAWLEFFAPWCPDWNAIDFRAAAVDHYQSLDLSVPNFDERLRACELHIGLDVQRYCAFKGRWQDLEDMAKRTLEIGRHIDSRGVVS